MEQVFNGPSLRHLLPRLPNEEEYAELKWTETEPRSGYTSDEVNVLTAGANYGWPGGPPGSTQAAAVLPAAIGGIGDCAVLQGNLYVTSLDDKSLLSATLTAANPPKPGSFSENLKATYGRLLTVVAAPDNSLWLTTSNKDGHGSPVSADERVLHIPPPVPASGGTSNA